MLKTQQHALLQATNQQLIQIRQNELNYYLNVCTIFGQQAALIAGFAYSSLTQIVFNPNSTFAFYTYAQDSFWICTAVCMGVSVHVILTTIYLQVHGQGLSIHGPIGSMARAVEGMRFETREVFGAYIVMIFFFALSMLTSFWTVMTVRAAAICTAFFLFIACQWYRYSLRIYNKFYVKRLFYLGMNDQTAEDERDPTKKVKEVNITSAKSILNQTPSTTASTKSIFGKIQSIFGKRETMNDIESANNVGLSDPVSNNDSQVRGDWETVHAEGFLAVNETETVVKKKSNSANDKEKWVRRYVVITLEGEVYFYKNKFQFKEEPDVPLRSRPIRLVDYTIKSETILDDKLKIDTFFIILEHKDKDEGIRPWVFRCDSEEERDQWLDSFQSGVLLCEE